MLKQEKKTQFNVLHMMSNVAWPKWKIYYDFLQLTLQCLFKRKNLNLGKSCYWQKLSFIVQIAHGGDVSMSK